MQVPDLARRSEMTTGADPDRTPFGDFELLEVEDIAAAVLFMVSRPRRMAVNENPDPADRAGEVIRPRGSQGTIPPLMWRRCLFTS